MLVSDLSINSTGDFNRSTQGTDDSDGLPVLTNTSVTHENQATKFLYLPRIAVQLFLLTLVAKPGLSVLPDQE